MAHLENERARGGSTILATRELAVWLLSRAFARCAALFRVSLYVFAVLAAFSVYGVHSARGAIGERSLALGRELEGMRDLLGSTKSVELNGQRMMLSTAVVPLDVRAALDRFEALCRERPNTLAQAVDLVPGARTAAAEIPLARRLGILRKEGERDGVIACIARREDRAVELSEFVESLTRTLDIGLLGNFFYVYVRDASTRDKTQSHVITSWTNGSFRPAAMFPIEGDAPGTDSSITGRPGNARRVLSGVAIGAPYAIRIYEAAESPQAMLAAFDASMTRRGFTRLRESRIREQDLAYVQASGVTVFVSAGRTMEGERTVFAIVEMSAGNGITGPRAEDG